MAIKATQVPDIGDVKAAPPGKAPPVAATPPVEETGFVTVHASPSVRKFARELGVDLNQVSGTARKGRITEGDVKAYVRRILSAGMPAAPVPAQARGAEPVPTVDFAKFGEIETRPLSRIKRLSGANLHRAWLNVPLVTHHEEADITETEAFRKGLAEDTPRQGVRVTLLSFLLKASVAALKEFPEFNASLDPSGENLILKKYYHIGVAVDTPDGLVVPVIRDVDRKNIYALSAELGTLSGKARDKQLKAQDLQGACFTISSLGGIGGISFTPLVNAPEVAILGVTRSKMAPVWDGKQFTSRLRLPLSLSYDHRVIDGAAAARFAGYLAGLVADVRQLLR